MYVDIKMYSIHTEICIIYRFAYLIIQVNYFSPQHDLQLILSFEMSYLASPGLAKAKKK
jgi:hypothetical protein